MKSTNTAKPIPAKDTTKTTKPAKTTTAQIIPVDTKTAWTFSAETISLAGHTFPAAYSIAREGDVYVFAQVEGTPVRVHVGTDMPMFADCLAAAQAAKAAKAEAAPVAAPAPAEPAQDKPTKAAKAAKAEAAPTPVAAPAPAEPAQDKPAKAAKAAKPKAAKPKAAPAPAPAPVEPAQDKPAKAAKAAEQPKAAPAPVTAPAPAPEAVTAPAPVEKPWIGTTIEGNGWKIIFDAEAQRTRVIVDAEKLTDTQRAAIEAAGFFWSPLCQSWNKKLTCKAHRAALALAETLNALK